MVMMMMMRRNEFDDEVDDDDKDGEGLGWCIIASMKTLIIHSLKK